MYSQAGMKMHCPICKKPVDSETHAEFPFCSERCRLLDLGNWSSEKYVVSESALDETLFEQIERDLKKDDNAKN
ncbi:MAG TPA: DNA gyrase inhibitor YacG [Candidatus Acidoferrum sp.]|nr:DNA gyrase inhibitor YacG [Candidatus Acidoferrum sp.]